MSASVEHAHEIDRKNENDFWRKAIEKEIHAGGASFYILDEKNNIHYGWSKVTGHLAFHSEIDFIPQKDGFLMIIKLILHLDMRAQAQ